ncbi:MAG: AbrB/MazE/SpoVT family DNA-binding domain-containing protein [Ruminococcaceae bacterium]|nr:AbrB/MazE/SpoVT family DNA-binding domain-containing protein [Oscillospiraceae bacterium]
MNFTGIVRQVDTLGRLVIPRELRKMLDITDGVDSFEIYVNEAGHIVLKKYNPACALCGNKDGLVSHGDKLVCNNCIDALNKQREG